MPYWSQDPLVHCRLREIYCFPDAIKRLTAYMSYDFLIYHRRKELSRVFRHRLFGYHAGRFIALMMAMSLFIISGKPIWQGVGMGGAVLMALLYRLSWLRHLKLLDTYFALQGEEPVHIQMDEECFRHKSKLCVSELKWGVFTKLLIHPEYMLLFYNEQQFLTLPSGQVPEEARQFIRKMFEQRNLPVVIR